MNLLDCLTIPTNFSLWGESLPCPKGYELYYRDNGSNVLGVAHLDSVMWGKPIKNRNMVRAPQLDDRLGVWVLLGLLPRFGINLDILLTDGEESGRTTGEYFDPPKQYNWIAEFDRAGDDVVMYHYECGEYLELMEDYGFRVGLGSFSDISQMDHLDATAFNFGIGYQRQHTKKCCADLRITIEAVERFARFYSDFKDEYLEFKGDECGWWGESYWECSDKGIWSKSKDLWADEEYSQIREVARNFGYENVLEFIEQGGLQYWRSS